ncbi:DASH complex subunit DAD4 [Hyaloscypha finlandica]|nr:DASH complex subunit DAD4 [Hyaloscypha finlandica]
MLLNKSLQEINIQNMNVELVAQMFKNYQSNVLFHLEGCLFFPFAQYFHTDHLKATDSLKDPS